MARKKLLRPRHEPEYDEPVWLGLSRSGWGTWGILAGVVVVFFILGVAGFTSRLEFGVIFVFLLVLLAIIVVVTALVDVKVMIDSKGILIRCGAFSKPKRFIPWNEIKAVDTTDVSIDKLGGFGFRWYPIKNGTGAIMRNGEGLEIQLTNGSRFLVTVDNAASGAAFAQQFVN